MSQSAPRQHGWPAAPHATHIPLPESDEQNERGPQVAPGQQRPSGAPHEVSHAPCTHAPSRQIEPGQQG